MSLAALAGCSPKPLANRLVWDAAGCAYVLQDGAGEIYFLNRQIDSDRETCRVKP